MPMDLMHRTRSASGPINRRSLGVHRLLVQHARVVHEHHRLSAPVDGDGIERVATDQAADFVERGFALMDGF